MPLQCNLKKTVQVINYFIQLTSSKKVGKAKLFALIYLVDRYHLRKFGRLITNDQYIATEKGPVGLAVTALCEQSGELTFDEENYATDFLERAHKDQNVRSVEKVNLNVLSNSDIDSLEAIAESFSRKGRNDLIEITQSFTEWQKVSGKIGKGFEVKMDTMDFFLGSSSEFEFIDIFNDEIATSREIYLNGGNA